MRGELVSKLVGEIKKKLEALLERAYAPYSGVRVSAAVVTEKDNVYYGVNVENASLGLTICAERAAIAAMIAGGERKLKAVFIASSLPDPIPPCGACRQVIVEFGGPETLIVSFSPRSGREKKWLLRELLPEPFLGWR